MRRRRIRARLRGSADCPRLSVFRSNAHIFGQLIDDDKGITLLSVGDYTATKKAIGTK